MRPPPGPSSQDDGDGRDVPGLAGPGLDDPLAEAQPARGSRRRVSPWPLFGALIALAVAAALGLYAYHRHQERRIVALSIARAEQLVRSDTWLGYHEAAALLAVRAAELDPVEAGALRAFALAMLALDYRDEGAASKANATLQPALRAATVPPYANLAVAAAALARGQAGTALEYAVRAGEGGLPQFLEARVALMAGNATVAAEALERAIAADPQMPAARALQADLFRRVGKADQARDGYLAALAASSAAVSAGLSDSGVRAGAAAPHARATFGIGKLALSHEIAPEAATAALSKLLGDRAGSPQVERSRAALYLSALQGRAGDRSGASASVEAAGLDGALRAWLERASGQLEVERGRYAVPEATPPPSKARATTTPMSRHPHRPRRWRWPRRSPSPSMVSRSRRSRGACASTGSARVITRYARASPAESPALRRACPLLGRRPPEAAVACPLSGHMHALFGRSCALVARDHSPIRADRDGTSAASQARSRPPTS